MVWVMLALGQHLKQANTLLVSLSPKTSMHSKYEFFMAFQQLFMPLLCLAVAGLVGWPFAAAVGLPMVVEEVVLKAWYTKLASSHQAVMALRTGALLLVVLVCCILIAVRFIMSCERLSALFWMVDADGTR